MHSDEVQAGEHDEILVILFPLLHSCEVDFVQTHEEWFAWRLVSSPEVHVGGDGHVDVFLGHDAILVTKSLPLQVLEYVILSQFVGRHIHPSKTYLGPHDLHTLLQHAEPAPHAPPSAVHDFP